MKSTWDSRAKQYRVSRRVAAAIDAASQILGPNGISRWAPNDCVPHGISFATGIPYWKVVDALYEHVAKYWSRRGHRPGKGWYPSQYQDPRFMERLGVQMVWEGRCKLKYRDTGYGYDSYDSRGRRLSLDIDVSPTLARVLDGEARKGRYLFLQRRHLIGVVDGVPHHVVWPNPGWGRRARCQEIALIIQD